MIFLLSTLAQSIITFGILIVFIILFLINRQLIEKYKETINGKMVIASYILLFIILAGAIFGIFIIWGYSFQITWDEFLLDATAFFERSIGGILGTLATIFVSMLIYKVTKIAMFRVGKKESPSQRRKKTIAKVTVSIVKYFVGLLGILVILAIWGVNVLPALAGLGMMGLVIGLGAQKFINDLISGFFIIFEHHFDVGDTIEVKGFKGIVTDIGLKTTKIRNWKGEVKILSNGDINDITNFSRNPSTAVVEFGIAYKEDVQKTMDILTLELPKIREKFEQIIEDPVVMGVTALDNSSVNLRVIAKTMTEQHYAVERGIRKFVKEVLDANGIEIPFPQVVVHTPSKK